DNLELIEEPPVEEVDKSALEELVHTLQSEDLDESLYTEETRSVFASALEDAELVLANEDATQAEVDEALLNLTEAYDNLELIEEPPGDEVDKSSLEDLLDTILSEQLNQSSYTEDSWFALIEAMEYAKHIIEKEDATEEEVNQAL